METWFPSSLTGMRYLQSLYRDEKVVLLTDLGSKYVDRTEIRGVHRLSRSDYGRLVVESLDLGWIVESVRWCWAEGDLYVSSMTLVQHLTP